MTEPRVARRPAAADGEAMLAGSRMESPAGGTRSILEKCRTYTAPDDLRAAGLFTFFRTIESGQDPVVMMGGREMVMLGSNNYLGLTSHPKIKERAIAAIRKYGAGCAGSRLLNGTLDIHVELEERLADFMKKPACVTFSTGFGVNLGVISSLAGKGDSIYLDRQDHACIFDGARLAVGAEVKKFKHNDPADLRRLLALNGDRSGRLLVIDGVFSMEGDIAPLPDYVRICDDYDMAIMVDDAHGVGVLGAHGRGTSEHFGIEDRVDLIMGTFSKSLATVGGFVVGEPDVIKFVKHRARALMFTAAPPPASVAAVLAALDIIESEPERRDRLWENTRFMLTALRAIGFDCGESSTPVIPVVVGPDMVAFKMAKRLEEEGVFVNAVVSPASPPGARPHPDVLHGDPHARAPDARGRGVPQGGTRARARGVGKRLRISWKDERAACVPDRRAVAAAPPPSSPSKKIFVPLSLGMSSIQIETVSSSSDLKAFVELPYRLYARRPELATAAQIRRPLDAGRLEEPLLASREARAVSRTARRQGRRADRRDRGRRAQPGPRREDRILRIL